MNDHHPARSMALARLRSMLLSPLIILVVAGAMRVPLNRPAQDPEFVVIVNAGNQMDSISIDQLSKIFLKKIRQWESDRTIQVVEQRMSARVRRLFAEEIHRRSVAAVSAYWQQQIFSGRAVPPPERATDREVVDYVATYTDAIGYVTPGTPLGPHVKAITVLR